ncbi:hypothetical protein ACFLSY_06825 [Bacteroidota bacterium]
MKSFNKRRILIILCVCFFQIGVNGQWVDDPYQNTVICDNHIRFQLQKIQITSQGNYLISYLRGNPNNSTILQLLDPNGYSLWQNNGITVNSNLGSYAPDYDFIIDPDDNAIIATSDIRYGDPIPVIYKIDQHGNFLWGDNGIELLTPKKGSIVSRLCLSTNNYLYYLFSSYYATWFETESNLYLHKISPDGSLVWEGEGILFSDSTYRYWIIDIIPQLDDGCMIVYYKNVGDYNYTIRNIYITRINPDGTKAWGSDLAVCTGIRSWVDVKSYSKDDGGVFLTWHDYRTTSYASSYLQYVSPEGSFGWEYPGIRISMDETGYQFDPRFGGINSLGEIIIFWKQTDSHQNNAALFGQKISLSEGRLWGDKGEMIIADLPNPKNTASITYKDTIFLVYNYPEFDNRTFTALHMTALDQDTNSCWDIPTVINAERTNKGNISLTEVRNDQMVIVYEDDDYSSNRRILAQNVFTNGQKGLRSTGIIENPVSESIKIVFDYTSSILSIKPIYEGKIIIRNQLGQIVYSDNIQFQIHLSHLPIGIYYVEIYKGNSRTYVKKMLLGN